MTKKTEQEQEQEVVAILFHDWKKYAQLDGHDIAFDLATGADIRLDYDVTRFLYRTGLVDFAYTDETPKHKPVRKSIQEIESVLHQDYQEIALGSTTRILVLQQEPNYLEVKITFRSGNDALWSVLIDYSGSYSVISFGLREPPFS